MVDRLSSPPPDSPQQAADWPRTPAGGTAQDLARLVEASPSSHHAAAEGARRLEAAGFSRLDEALSWSAQQAARPSFVLRDGALIAWTVPERIVEDTGFRVLGAHTDSPGFALKPRPGTGRGGWRRIGVEVYGGPLLNSWLDRELRLAGRVAVRADDGVELRLVATGPVARIPQLAIHLDRSANSALTLDRQQHTQPVWGCGDGPGDVLDLLAEHAGADSGADLLGWDVVLADTQPPRVFGARQEFLASGRLDNLTSVHAGLTALIERRDDLRAGRHIALLAAFDHEEVGSGTRSGAAGPFLEDVLARLGEALGWTEGRRRAALASSWCLSADAGHLLHPNYPGHHDPDHQPRPAAGPLLKVNADQRYATDAPGAARWRLACERAGVPTQEFVSRNDVPCGSTIGPLTAARLGLRTTDVGVGLLSMHSAREMVHLQDLHAFGQAVQEWLLD